MKRPAGAPAAKAAKAAKAARADPAMSSLNAVRAVLVEAPGYPPQVLEMIASGMENSLLVHKDRRHSYQEEVVGMIGEILAAVRAGCQTAVDDLAGKISASDAERAARAARVETATAAVAKKLEDVEAAKPAVPEAHSAVVAANMAAADAKSELKSAEQSLQSAAAKKAKVTAFLEGEYAAMKRGDAPDAKQAAKALARLCKEFDVEAQLVESTSAALARPAGERGSFDSMVLDQFEQQLASLVAAFDEQTAATEAGRAPREAKVEAAGAELSAAQEALKARKEELAAAQAALREAEGEKQAAERAVRDLDPELRRTEAELDEANGRVRMMGEVLKFYEQLRDRTTADEAQPERAEEPVGAPADGADAAPAPAEAAAV